MTPRAVVQAVAGPAGPIECAVDVPEGEPRGIALACHPHPQFGGTMDNKVVQTLARAYVQCGWKSVRFNFRGIGGSAGAWDEGRGELEDARAVLAAFRSGAAATQPFLVGGFSFGGWIAAELVASLPEADPPQRVVLVAPSTQQHRLPVLAPGTVVVHGEADDVVPLASTLDWARPLGLPVIVFPGVGHFFHGKISVLKNVLVQQLQDVRQA
jgi:alpha/beta superfamily hydrolase